MKEHWWALPTLPVLGADFEYQKFCFFIVKKKGFLIFWKQC
jgi:hypothetical protein